ncbi:MAG: UDP-galactopyranose mutase [Verrucomicrobiota bacterium]
MKEGLRYLVVGAGMSGAVLARELATRMDGRVLVVDQRAHLAGNCHTERDKATGVMVHEYGPHIFNTNNERVWRYVNEFGNFRSFTNRVKAVTEKGVFSMPINLHTINQYFGKAFDPGEAREFVAGLGDTTIGEPKNFEEQALKFLGRELYEAFFLGYTKKQWGVSPRELPASVLKRLPVRFNYDDCYYDKKYQGIPEEGYTSVVERMLAHEAIEVRLGETFRASDGEGFSHVFYTGPIDAYFDYEDGRLGYRTVTFRRHEAEGDHQGNAVLNYPGEEVPYTRVHEHKHFAPWEEHERTVYFEEYSQETGPEDEPFFPKRLVADKEKLAAYRDRAESLGGVSFLGRLGTYRYMDMEKVIGEALEFVDGVVVCGGERIPVFPNEEG